MSIYAWIDSCAVHGKSIEALFPQCSFWFLYFPLYLFVLSYNLFSTLTAFAFLDMLGLIIIPKPQYGRTQTHDHPWPLTPNFLSQVALTGFWSPPWKTVIRKTSVPALQTIAVDLGSPYMQKVGKLSRFSLGRRFWQQVEEGKEEKVKGG